MNDAVWSAAAGSAAAGKSLPLKGSKAALMQCITAARSRHMPQSWRLTGKQVGHLVPEVILAQIPNEDDLAAQLCKCARNICRRAAGVRRPAPRPILTCMSDRRLIDAATANIHTVFNAYGTRTCCSPGCNLWHRFALLIGQAVCSCTQELQQTPDQTCTISAW